MRFVAILLLAAGILSAQDKVAPGVYKGTWAGASAGGDFRLTLKPDSQGSLAADIVFTLEGAEVACKIISVKVDGPSIAIVYSFDLQGNALQSLTLGTLKGKSLAGTYKTSAGDSAVDEGTWKTTAQ
jgi:hypothetical protein